LVLTFVVCADQGELMQTRMKTRIQKRLLLYLLVFQMTSIWGLANRIFQAYTPNHKYSYFLLCMDSAFGPLQVRFSSVWCAISLNLPFVFSGILERSGLRFEPKIA
jgi:hypothetical protein